MNENQNLEVNQKAANKAKHCLIITYLFLLNQYSCHPCDSETFKTFYGEQRYGKVTKSVFRLWDRSKQCEWWVESDQLMNVKLDEWVSMVVMMEAIVLGYGTLEKTTLTD